MSSVGHAGKKTSRFGPYEIDLDQRLLFRAGDPIPLTPKAFDTLAALASRPGKLMEKGELLKLVWPDTFVEENNLTQNISVLRKAFGDHEYIETIPRRGYRFLAEVESPPPPDVAPQRDHRGRSRVPWLWLALVVVLVAIVATFVIRRFVASRPLAYRVDSLVVLPFANLSADPELDYFSDGLTEELTNVLAQLKDVRVVARTTAFQFKAKAVDIRSIAQQLHVSTVLEGSVRREQNRFRVTAQLNDAQSGYHIWSKTYDRAPENVFDVQEEISNQIARTIRPDVRPAKAVRGTRNPQAYNFYLLGRFHRQRRDSASIHRAIGFLQQATQLDPEYAAPYATLAECYTLLAWETKGISPVTALAEAQKAVDRALALDENLADAHTSQAIVYLQLARKWPAAEQQFQRAFALNSNDSAAHHWFSHYLVAMNRLSESLTESRRALELDPLDILISAHLIWNYLRMRDYPNAVKAGLQTLDLDPNSELAYLFLAWTYENSEQWEKAIEAWQHTGKRHPDSSTLRAALRAHGSSGYWRARLAFLLQQKIPNVYQVAVLYSRVGESSKALDYLERAAQLHEPELLYMHREPAFDALAGAPRFKTLSETLQLP